jgi:hypothetical protein
MDVVEWVFHAMESGFLLMLLNVSLLIIIFYVLKPTVQASTTQVDDHMLELLKKTITSLVLVLLLKSLHVLLL